MGPCCLFQLGVSAVGACVLDPFLGLLPCHCLPRFASLKAMASLWATVAKRGGWWLRLRAQTNLVPTNAFTKPGLPSQGQFRWKGWAELTEDAWWGCSLCRGDEEGPSWFAKYQDLNIWGIIQNQSCVCVALKISSCSFGAGYWGCKSMAANSVYGCSKFSRVSFWVMSSSHGETVLDEPCEDSALVVTDAEPPKNWIKVYRHDPNGGIRWLQSPNSSMVPYVKGASTGMVHCGDVETQVLKDGYHTTVLCVTVCDPEGIANAFAICYKIIMIEDALA